MRRKCEGGHGGTPCDKLRKTGNESHSTAVCALIQLPRADAMAGIPAHADAWRAAGRQASACAGMPAIASARGSWMRAQTAVECDSFPVLRNLSQGVPP